MKPFSFLFFAQNMSRIADFRYFLSVSKSNVSMSDAMTPVSHAPLLLLSLIIRLSSFRLGKDMILLFWFSLGFAPRQPRGGPILLNQEWAEKKA